MAIMTDDVISKNFTATQLRRGYDEQEVDDFLDKVPVDLRRLTSDNDDLSERIPPEAAERARAATEAADEIAKSALAAGVPAAAGLDSAAGVLVLAQKLHDEYVCDGQNTRERLISEGQSHHDQVVGEATARHEELLSTGQAKYDEFVSVGEAKHHQFVSVGQAKHDELVSVGQAKHDELVSVGQAKHDELVSVGEAKADALIAEADALIAEADALIAEATAEHEHMITEARELSTGMIAKAQQKRAEVFQALDHERSLLQKEIEELRTFQRDHRTHLKSYLEGQLIELEQTGAAETG
jgi:DivIVA domain-containing protein